MQTLAIFSLFMAGRSQVTGPLPVEDGFGGPPTLEAVESVKDAQLVRGRKDTMFTPLQREIGKMRMKWNILDEIHDSWAPEAVPNAVLIRGNITGSGWDCQRLCDETPGCRYIIYCTMDSANRLVPDWGPVLDSRAQCWGYTHHGSYKRSFALKVSWTDPTTLREHIDNFDVCTTKFQAYKDGAAQGEIKLADLSGVGPWVQRPKGWLPPPPSDLKLPGLSVSATTGCFPGHAQVLTRQGPVDIAEIAQGDEVMVEENGEFKLSPVLTFIHRTRTGIEQSYLEIFHKNGIMRVTENHIVFTCDGSPGEKLAGELRTGDSLCSMNDNKVAPSEVVRIERRMGTRGNFAPLTATGTIVVDGVVASNYATPSMNVPLSHGIAHKTMLPLRAYHTFALNKLLVPVWRLTCQLLDWKQVCAEQADLEIHQYASLLQEMRLDRLVTLIRSK
eukprot:gnl/TRDRNA2_/TRDRNA2_85688_c0_seq1.p1 gnl/TRDRNA2_/TRDRNA2_85688_c0~~gnl/TRDRNA2_/TRDRNA2_85688_c0_seq1.p1  ORF type:complete len:445 (-),score=56.52 gnl/TRDRNA2_/TRDRNA2_85688_c0_seq1:157-1491(-)